jgi:hypothetical protein
MLNSFPSEESYDDIDHQADILLAILADYRTDWQSSSRRRAPRALAGRRQRACSLPDLHLGSMFGNRQELA